MDEYLNNNIDILILTGNDWANTGYRFSKCLEQIGLNVVILKGHKHKFNYPIQAPIVKSLSTNAISNYPIIIPINDDDDIILKLMEHAKVINFHASTLIKNGNFNYANKNIVVTHGGTTYRRSPNKTNKIFNSISLSTIIQCPDLLNLGAKNETLVYYPVDTEFIQPCFDRINATKLVIGHFPSSGHIKGTRSLLSFCYKLHKKDKKYSYYKFICSERKVPWIDNIKRMQNCDIYIEALCLTNHGKKYGEWGNTCLEAASCGCIVITHCLSKDIYKEQYGCDLPILIANNYVELQQHLDNLLEMTDQEILNLKQKIRNWAENYHGFQATGERLWNKIYKPLFPDKEFNSSMGKVVAVAVAVDIEQPITYLDIKYQTCLVTGGAGFIGSHICEKLLKQGRKVKCLDNFVNGKMKNIEDFLDNPNFELITASVTDIIGNEVLLNKFSGIDIVFHLACGKCTVCLHDPKLDLFVNAWGSYNVFEASRLHSVKKVIHASTGSIYGEPQYFPEDENHPYKPTSFYGVSKLAGERYLEVFYKMYGLKYSILRYFHVYGTRQDHADLGGVIPIFIRNVLKDENIKIYGDGSQIRCFTHVEDIVNANILCANTSTSDGECYNIASGIKMSILELANKIKQLANKPDININYYDWRPGDIKYFDVSNKKISKLGLQLNTNIYSN